MTPDLFPVSLVAAGIVVGLIFLLVRRFFRKRRINHIIEIAQNLGLHPPVDPDAAFDRISRLGFLLLSKVQNPIGGRVKYLLEGRKDGCKLYLFDYEAIQPHETNTLQSVIVVENESKILPQFALIPSKLKKERFTQRLRTAPLEFTSRLVSRYRKIDAPIDGYHLSCPVQSEQPVLNLMNARITGYFSAHRKFSVEGRGKAFLIYQRERLISPGHLEAFIREGMLVYHHFKDAAAAIGSEPNMQNSVGTASPSA